MHSKPSAWAAAARFGAVVGILGLLAAPAVGKEVVKWVDDEGRVHFSEPHLAQGPTESVRIAPANGMDKAEYSEPAQGRGNLRLIKKSAKKNKEGWQGYSARRARSRY